MDDFVLYKENVFSPEWCEKAIGRFEKAIEIGNGLTRQQNNEGGKLKKDDTAWFPSNLSEEVDTKATDLVGEFNEVFWNVVYPEYAQKYEILNDLAPHKIYTQKMQKTKIGQGYHVWHTENMSKDSCQRVLTYILYLNDVEDGGETELLYYHKRFKPKAGSVLLFPAGFTHTHRGNPPLSNDKYIITGWVEY